MNVYILIAGLALNYILQNNFKENVGMRPNARKIGVLVTDGKSQDDIIGNSQNLRDQGIELYAIGESLFLSFRLKIGCDNYFIVFIYLRKTIEVIYDQSKKDDQSKRKSK